MIVCFFIIESRNYYFELIAYKILRTMQKFKKQPNKRFLSDYINKIRKNNMNKITSKELRETWIKFYESKGHTNIGAVSLIGDGTTGVMFNVAGMQPLMPYLLGEKHPKGTRLCNVQGCVRTIDIDSVGDESHCTFFEINIRIL